ncbi:hypothetical protein CSPX01_15435 [Colletotrichum filicis]|nr:hypothetical protein CSPX01_15435 [Colletotrichum filicis]
MSTNRLHGHFRERFPRLLKPAMGKFAPIIVHYEDTDVQVNPITDTKVYLDQRLAGLLDDDGGVIVA